MDPPWFVTENTTVCSGPCPPGQVITLIQQELEGSTVEVVQDTYQVQWKSIVGAEGSPKGVPPNVVRVDLRMTWQDSGSAVGGNRVMTTTFYKYNWDQ